MDELNESDELASSLQSDENYFDAINTKIKDYVKNTNNKAIKVVDFKTPEEILELIDFNFPEKSEAQAEQKILEIFTNIIKLSVKTNHPHYFNSLSGGIDKYALSADFITSVLNSSMYSFEMAPVFSVMEWKILELLSGHIGWQTFDGLFCPGGSITNLYCLLISRHHKFPEVNKVGMKNLPDFVVFTSELGHYSYNKSANVIGIGDDNIIKIPTDEDGIIIVHEFELLIEKAKSESKICLALNCTIGTTVFGSSDPLKELVRVCQKNGIWLHLDACFGGSMILLEEYKNTIFTGIESADSISIDAHKVFPIPFQCSIFLTKHSNSLKKCNAQNAEYLFMKDKVLYNPEKYDKGDSSIQCGRHVDVLKLFIYLKAHGLEKTKHQIRKAIENSKYLAKLVNDHPNFHLIKEPDFVNVCFFYFSDRIKAQNLKEGKIDWQDVYRLPPLIKAQMTKEGTMMVAYQTQSQAKRKLGNFFRTVTTVDKTKEDMEFIIQEIHRLGKNL